jgi:CCR4-NOT transcription complex subunit 1
LHFHPEYFENTNQVLYYLELLFKKSYYQHLVLELYSLFNYKYNKVCVTFYNRIADKEQLESFLSSAFLELPEKLYLGLELAASKHKSLGFSLLEQCVFIVKYTEFTQEELVFIYQFAAVHLHDYSNTNTLLTFVENSLNTDNLNYITKPDLFQTKNIEQSMGFDHTVKSVHQLIKELNGVLTFPGKENIKEFIKNIYNNDLTDTDIAILLLGIYHSNLPATELDTKFQQLRSNEELPHVEPGEQFLTCSFFNTEYLYQALAELKPGVKWLNVVKEFDSPDFVIVDPVTLKQFLAFLSFAFEEASKIPIKAFIGSKWKNVHNQVYFLKLAIISPDVINFSDYLNTKKVITFEELALVTGNSKNILTVLYHQTWNCVELFELFTSLIKERQEDIASMIDLASKQSSELVCLALAYINPQWPPLKDLQVKLTCGFILGQLNSSVVINRLCHMDLNLVIHCMIELHRRDPTCISRLLDVAQEMKSLTQVLDSTAYPFTIDMAALASRREHLNLEKWLQDHVQSNPEPFLRSCLDFLIEKMSHQISKMDGNPTPPFIPLSVEVMQIFLKTLSSYSNMMSKELLDGFHAIQKALGSNSQALAEEPVNEGMAPSQFPANIEEEANVYFEKIYAKELSVKELIDILAELKASKVQKDRDVFMCMIHNLFDEYRFFPKYPEKELGLTAILFGSLIQYQLISFEPLGVALRYVLEALRKPPGSKMFKFGIQALLQFQSRLAEWPQYCTHLLSIAHMHQVFPDLIAYLKQVISAAGTNAQNAALNQSILIGMNQGMIGMNQGAAAMNLGQSTSESSQAIVPPVPVNHISGSPSFQSIRLHVLREELGSKVDIPIPSEQLQDKILFIINNISAANIEQKTEELVKILNEDSYSWFANHLVVKRSAQEPNYHSTYVDLLEGLKNEDLDSRVLYETLKNIKELITSEKTVTSSTERTILKNLGTWLGCITVGKNRPLLYRYVSLRELLLEGFDSDRLIVVIPFVCKVLEKSSKSIIFKPPNPWLMRLLKVLVELYHYADLKLNLKFEIEVLCKNIEVDITTIDASKEIRLKTVEAPALPEASAPSVPVGHVIPAIPPPSINQAAHISTTGELTLISNLVNFVSLNHPIHPALKKIIVIAIDFSIREVVGPVVERSVAIACITTREIVLKDFAFDGNEEKLRKCAIQMVQNVAGNLSMATSKEPLRSTMISNIKNFMQVAGFEGQLSEQMIQAVVDENMDLACAFIEKSAVEKSVADISETLSGAFQARIKHKEFLNANPNNENLNFFDSSFVNSTSYFVMVPDQLRPRPSGLSTQQTRVYEYFLSTSRLNMLAPLATPLPALSLNDYEKLGVYLKSLQKADTNSAASNVYFDESSKTVLSTQQSLERFLLIVTEVEQIVYQNPNLSLSSFPANHELRSLLRQILLVVLHAYNRDEVALVFSQKVVQILYKTESPLFREISVILLDKLCEISPKVAKEVTTWIIYADDERKYNVPVTIALLLSGLLNVVEYDMQLAKVMETGRGSAVEFCVKLIRKCVLDEPSIASPYDFVYSIETLNRVAQRSKGGVPEPLLRLLEDVSKKIQSAKEDEPNDLRNRIAVVFNDWLRLFQYPNKESESDSRSTLYSFVSQLYEQGVFVDNEVTSLFFKVCTELSVEYYLKNRSNPSHVAYQAIDAFGRLIVMLLAVGKERYVKDKDRENSSPVHILSQILSIVSMLLVQALERRNFVVQRPFSRLFIVLLKDLKDMKTAYEEEYLEFLSVIGQLLHVMNPQKVSSFTFAWLEIVSNKNFMPVLLERKEGWPHIQRLLIDVLTFLFPYMKNVEMKESIRVLYRGFLRILLVILHDYPDFLSEYCKSFCHVIPSTCVQLRNLVLSAFPKTMKLIDPFTPDLTVESLVESKSVPTMILSLAEEQLKQEVLGEFVKRNFNEIKKYFFDRVKENGVFNMPFLETFIYTVGLQGLLVLNDDGTLNVNISSNFSMDIFFRLLQDLDSEGKKRKTD